MNETQPIEDLFAKVPLFKRLSGRQRARLAGKVTRRTYRQGAVIVRQGDTSMSLYVVIAGAVRIERESEAGAPVQVNQAGAGGFFGEMGLIDDVPRAATVVAVEPTECALLAKWDFENELRNDPDIALALLPVLNKRIRELDARLTRERPEAQPV